MTPLGSESVPTLRQIALPAGPSWSNIKLVGDGRGDLNHFGGVPSAGCAGQNMRKLTRLDRFKRFPGSGYVVAMLAVIAAVIAGLLLEIYLQASPTVSLF